MNPSTAIPLWADLVARNPYRVLGLPGDSSWADIQARVARLRASPGSEDETTAWDLRWFAPLPRAAADVQGAAARLADPVQRLRDRLFWFHESVSEMAVQELLPTNLRNALEGWSATSQPLARHDAALVALIKALTLDPAVEDAATWRRLFQEWRSAIALDEYWMAVLRLEMGGGFENPASLADLREVREGAEGRVAGPLLEIARVAVLSEDLARAARALAVLRETLPPGIFQHACGDLASHVWGRFDADWPVPAGADAPAADSPPGEISLDVQKPGLWDLGLRPILKERRARTRAAKTGAPPTPGGADAMAEEPAPTEAGPVETRGPTPGDLAATGESEPSSNATTEPAPTPVPTRETEASVAPPLAAPPAGPAPRDTASRPATATGAAPTDGSTEAISLKAPAAEPLEEAPRAEPAAEAPTSDGIPDVQRIPPPRAGRRLRPVWIGGIAASVAVAVALAALDPGGSAGDDEEPPDPVTLTVLEERLDQSYGDVAETMVARMETDIELTLVERGIDGYEVLLEDYRRRASYGLPVDRNAWNRVASTHERFVERRDSLRLETQRLVAVQDSLEVVDGSLLAAYNLLLRSGSSAREPSPR